MENPIEEAEGPKKGVTITTIHEAKGLEWKRVFVPRCYNDFLPSPFWPDKKEGFGYVPDSLTFETYKKFGGPEHTWKTPMDKFEKACMEHLYEECRVLYVAMTRARDGLVISYPRMVADRDGRQDKMMSCFLRDIINDPNVLFRKLP